MIILNGNLTSYNTSQTTFHITITKMLLNDLTPSSTKKTKKEKESSKQKAN